MSKWGVTHCPMCERPLAQDEEWEKHDTRKDLCWSWPHQCGYSTVEERLIEVLTKWDEEASRIANIDNLEYGVPCKVCGSPDGWVCLWCLEGDE